MASMPDGERPRARQAARRPSRSLAYAGRGSDARLTCSGRKTRTLGLGEIESQASIPTPAEGNSRHVAGAQAHDQVYTRGYVLPRSRELAVVMGISDFNRLIARLDGCQPGDWADLWLALAGAAAGLGASALTGALTLPPSMPGTTDVLWVLTAAGSAIFCLCVTGYFTQRCDQKRGIGELKKDLEIHLPGATSAPHP